MSVVAGGGGGMGPAGGSVRLRVTTRGVARQFVTHFVTVVGAAFSLDGRGVHETGARGVRIGLF